MQPINWNLEINWHFAVASPQSGVSSTDSRSHLEMLVFAEGGKPENRRKNPRSKGENQQQPIVLYGKNFVKVYVNTGITSRDICLALFYKGNRNCAYIT